MFDVTSDDTYYNVQHWVRTVKQVRVDPHFDFSVQCLSFCFLA